MRTLNQAFPDDEYQQLKEEKGDRTWREAILDEFGVSSDD